ncbi:MAG: hypothetical protein AMXMBFR46_14400 [Acidimicrobiia bacterium]
MIDFGAIGKWYDLLPWREWRAGPQAPLSRPVAEELTALAGTPAASRHASPRGR